jgi:hypothetical protein
MNESSLNSDALSWPLVRNDSHVAEMDVKNLMTLTWNNINVIKSESSFSFKNGLTKTEKNIINNGKKK